MKIAILDCFSGISGNMMVGALIDAGVPFSFIEERLECLELPDWRVRHERMKKNGIEGCFFSVSDETDPPHRSWSKIRRLIEESSLMEDEKQLSIAVFLRIAEAEALAHGVSVDKVHFHEVGALDSIIDVVASVCGWLWLKRSEGIERLYCAGTNLGGGTVKCAHGMMPIPAPATARILEGFPVWSDGDFEMTTPTGAAVIAEICDVKGLPDRWTPGLCGLGCGSRDGKLPNLTRLMIGELCETAEANDFYQIEAVVDDMTGEMAAHAQQQLLMAGALEVLLVNCINKGRPALLFRLLCRSRNREELTQMLYRETTTIGCRSWAVERDELKRAESPAGGVQVKAALSDSGELLNLKPEHRELTELARAKGISLKNLMQNPAFLAEVYSRRVEDC